MKAPKQYPILAALTALALCFTPVAQAQLLTSISPEVTLDNPAARNSNVGERLARSLASPLPQERHNALEETLFFTQFNNGQLDLSATVPALLSIYSGDPEEPHRVAAVAALHAIGDGASLKLLRHLVQSQTSRRVQVATLGALVDYFGMEAFEGAEDMAALAESLLGYQQKGGHGAKSPIGVATRH